MRKKINFNLYEILCIKINLKRNKGLNLKFKIRKYLDENIGKKFLLRGIK